MECNVPTDIVFSFTGFALRGGKTGPHADGWGLALYDGKFARSFLEPTPACDSRWREFIRDNPIKTLLAIAHVRKKTRGPRVAREHPPVQARAVGAALGLRPQRHAAARAAAQAARSSTPSARPTASTPSAGCSSSCAQPSPAVTRASRGGCGRRSRSWRRSSAPRASSTSCSADGRHLYARCGDQALLHHPPGALRPRHAARRRDGHRLLGGDQRRSDRVAVVATEPLTRDETWQHGTPGTLWVFNGGALRATLPSGTANRDPVRQRALSESLVPATTKAA